MEKIQIFITTPSWIDNLLKITKRGAMNKVSNDYLIEKSKQNLEGLETQIGYYSRQLAAFGSTLEKFFKEKECLLAGIEHLKNIELVEEGNE